MQRAWSDAELANPHARQDKADRVRNMFAAIAGSYDLNNRLHSGWRDQAWRRFAVKAAGVKPSDEVLDVACGTGDLTRAFAAAGPAKVVGLDFTRAMLDIAETKRSRPTDQGITYLEGDATALPFADASFDVVSIAFGIRNVSDPAKALREFARVLRPGGRLVVLEFDRPRVPVLGALADFYTKRIMPVTATLISRDRSGAYRYLPKSVETFMDSAALKAAMAEAGFGEIRQTGLSLGVCVCSVGRR
jgi:demethylmenaquinone methyltransferase/2-methoxy-6-polyprenyl-1,4-benzoquinol methylase